MKPHGRIETDSNGTAPKLSALPVSFFLSYLEPGTGKREKTPATARVTPGSLGPAFRDVPTGGTGLVITDIMERVRTANFLFFSQQENGHLRPNFWRTNLLQPKWCQGGLKHLNTLLVPLIRCVPQELDIPISTRTAVVRSVPSLTTVSSYVPGARPSNVAGVVFPFGSPSSMMTAPCGSELTTRAPVGIASAFTGQIAFITQGEGAKKPGCRHPGFAKTKGKSRQRC